MTSTHSSLIQTRNQTKRVPISKPGLKVYDENLGSKQATKPKTTATTRVVLSELTNVGQRQSKVTAQQPLASKEVKKKVTVAPSQQDPKVGPQKTNDWNAMRPQVTKKTVVEEPILDDSEGEDIVSDDLQLVLDPKSLDVNMSGVSAPVLDMEPMDIEIMDEDVEDIDELDFEDPQFCSEYVGYIFENCRKKEVADRINPQYMDKQIEINAHHRTILIDWLSEVAVKFKLLTETLFLTVQIIDRFLQCKSVARQKLQLVGVTAMLIASKFEEIYSPMVKDFIWITDKSYTREEVLKMERVILETLNFNLATPTILHFLRRFSKASRSDSKMHTLSKYLSELGLLEYKMLKYLPSMVAAAAVYITRKMTGVTPAWNKTLEFYTKYKEADIIECATELNAVLLKQKTSKYRSTTLKYASPKLLSVSEIPPVDI